MMTNKSSKPFIPGILINVTDECNFECQYCPPYGENLGKGVGVYDDNAVLIIINLAKKYGVKQIRFTGGEPFLEPERLRKFLDACGKSFERLVLNTNGSLLAKNFNWLKNYRNRIVLKISLDTLDEKRFNEITQRCFFKEVNENLLAAIKHNFNIELNAVLCKQSFEEVKNLIRFVVDNHINLKFLTTSTFYGNVDSNALNINMDKIIAYLNEHATHTSNERLVGDRGAPMLIYRIGESKVTIFDSLIKGSLTPLKCYFTTCEESCEFYPCDYGAFSIGISTDGIMSVCRGRKDLGEKIFCKSTIEIEEAFINQLKQFQSCFTINVNSL